MAFSSGVASQLGFKAETTYGTAVTVDKFIEVEEYGVAAEINWAVGEGMYSGGQYRRLDRTAQTTRSAKGSLKADVIGKNWGTLIKHGMGSSVGTPTVIAGSAYKQIHQVGSTDGLSLTFQQGVPQVGDGTVKPFTAVGTKVAGFELACESGGFLNASLDLIAKDLLTLTTTPASAALATASYPALQEGFTWNQAVVKLGGIASTGSGLVSISGGTTVTSMVKGFSLKHTNDLNAEGYGTGATFGREPKSKRATTVITLDSEFGTQAEFYDVFRAGTTKALQITFTGSLIGGSDYFVFDIVVAGAKIRNAPVEQNKDDLASHSIELEVGNDGTNSPLQVYIVSTDSAAL
jgi:hypothetical protein